MCTRCRQHALGIAPRRVCLDRTWTLARLGDPVALVLVPVSLLSLVLTIALGIGFVVDRPSSSSGLSSGLALFIEISTLFAWTGSLSCSSFEHSSDKTRRALRIFDRIRPFQLALLLAAVVFCPSLTVVVVEMETLAKRHRRQLPRIVYIALRSIRRTAMGRTVLSMIALGEGGMRVVAGLKAWSTIIGAGRLPGRLNFLGPTMAATRTTDDGDDALDADEDGL